jgi:hypothetical protein
MFFIPDECKGAGNTSAEAQRVWASLVRDYPSQGTSIRVDAPPVIGSRKRTNPRRNPDSARLYYHGSTGEKTAGSAEGALKDGFLRGRAVQQRSKLAPIVGRVYLTPSVEYAQIYALGGVLAGRDIHPSSIERNGRYGYMFVVTETELNDPWPDEDAVGQLVSDGLRNESTYRKSLGECPRWLVRLAEYNLTPTQLSRMRSLYAEYADEAAAGKKLVKKMTPDQRAELVSRGWAVASVGPTRFTQAWRIDKTRSAELREDGSNFFDIAERLPLQNPRRPATCAERTALSPRPTTTAERTDPALWEAVKREVTAGSKGGVRGEWSARKAQLAVALYKKRGGGYVGPKSPRNALAKWTREDWRTRSGDPSLVTGERYLPARAIEALTPAEYAATTRAKRAGLRRDEQFTRQPERIAQKTARYRKNRR